MAARQSYASVSAVMGSRDTLGVYQAMQQMRTLQLDLGWQRAHHCRDIGTILRNAATNTTERNLGNMDKKRFQQALVNAFPALNLSMALLEAISLNYPTGVPDSFTGVYPGVAWKSFVNDLNGVQPATPRQGGPMGGTEHRRQVLSRLSGFRCARHQRSLP